MPLTNAQKQQRWRDRNVVVLTADASQIAEQLMAMDDQKKLRKIADFINDHLRHPDRTLEERLIALGRIGMDGLNGALSKTVAIAKSREPSPTSSWRLEATTRDGKSWTNGVRLASREEAECYVEYFARHELESSGYVTADILHSADLPNCSITRRQRGGRPYLYFQHGHCARLKWQCESARPVAAPVQPPL